jgi:NAD(P)-dependent dehydrogenase (short-subunit alcohol dehydrogenase family)
VEDIFRLDGKVALVTGGAGGIGRSLALGLSAYGARVVVSSRNHEAICKAAEDIHAETKNETLAIPADVTDEQSVENLVKSTVSKMGTIDILVNAMGANAKYDAFDYPMDEWNRLMNVNVNGTMICCKHVGPIFKEKKQGKIINLSSIRGIRGYTGGNVGYCATKGAVELITKCLAIEWAPYNINVNALGPALIITPGTIHIQKDPARAEAYKKLVPLGRLAFPEDCIGACVFLASKASDYITGHTVYVDGGLAAK